MTTGVHRTTSRPVRRVAHATTQLLVRLAAVVVVGGLVGAFVLGYGCAYLPPESFWWTGPFAVLLPYVSLVLLPGALFTGARAVRDRSWWSAAVSMTVLVLIGLRFGPALMSQPGEASGPDLRVATYNAPVVGPSRDSLSDAFVRSVEAMAPDVLALQEPPIRFRGEGRVDARRTAPHVVALLERTPFDLPRHRPRRMVARQSVVGRIPADSLAVIEFEAPEALETSTQVARATFTWGGREVAIYSLHLHTVSSRKPWRDPQFQWTAPGTWGPYLEAYREAAVRRAWEARAIRRLIEKESRPFIVAGDFNSTVHHWEYRHVARGLQNAVQVAGMWSRATYPSDIPLVGIDHVLVSSEWTVVSAWVPESHPYADHRPVVARLQFR